MKRWLLIGTVILAAAAVIWGGVDSYLNNRQEIVQAKLTGLPAADGTGFARATGPKPIQFPQDFGAHPDYQTEWWYYTGNLDAADGHHFGYQLTFFRRAAAAPQNLVPRTSSWAANQIYLAHFALTDTAGNRFQSYERAERGAAGLAGAMPAGAGTGTNFRVWLDDWGVEQEANNRYQLHARQGNVKVTLTLEDKKGTVLEGDQGYSQKGPEPGNASYYFSQPLLISSGEVEVDGKVYPVNGTSWMDHEYSTSALSKGQVGWDWFALQLSDGSEFMVYRIRREDGRQDPFSSGMVIAPDGSTQRLDMAAVQIQPLGTWKSPHSRGVYPAGWKMQIEALGLDLEIQPYIPDQENNLSFTYWEGAVKISGKYLGKPISGMGYVELTGYAGSLAGQF